MIHGDERPPPPPRPGWLHRSTRTARWGLAVTVRSLRFVPPLLGLLVFLGLFLLQGGQAMGSVIATEALAAFVLALWFAIAHLGAMPRGHGEITQATVGRSARFAGDVAGAMVLASTAALSSVGWALALPVMARRPDAGGTAAWVVLVVAAAGAGVATGCLVHRLPVGAPARFVVAVGVVALVLARPALLPVVSWVLPPVMDTARGASTTFPPSAAVWWTTLGTVAWSVVALALACALGDGAPRDG